MPDVRHRIDVFGWNRLFKPHQPERLQGLRDFLSGRSIVAAMHVAGKVHVGRNGLAHVRNPLHHAINLAVARRPVNLIEARGIAGIVKVDLHRREALILDPCELRVRLRSGRVVDIRVAIDPNFIAEPSAHKLVHG